MIYESSPTIASQVRSHVQKEVLNHAMLQLLLQRGGVQRVLFIVVVAIVAVNEVNGEERVQRWRRIKAIPAIPFKVAL